MIDPKLAEAVERLRHDEETASRPNRDGGFLTDIRLVLNAVVSLEAEVTELRLTLAALHRRDDTPPSSGDGSNRMPICKESARGRCVECGGTYRLRRDGTVSKHGTSRGIEYIREITCPGTGRAAETPTTTPPSSGEGGDR